MEIWHDRNSLEAILESLLTRKIAASEVERWSNFLTSGKTLADLLTAIKSTKEFAARHAVPTKFPPGHYYSPVVDPEAVKDYVARQRALSYSDMAGIELRIDEMEAFWLSHSNDIAQTMFSDVKSDRMRFHYVNGSYPFGDAIMLRLMLLHFQSRRVIEIGSGYTTACMLDTFEESGIEDFSITCIEPYPDRLLSLLRENDWKRVNLLQQLVQTVNIDVFESLEAGDMLFVDSTHVVKTGSDVHFEIFDILPRLRPGVLIHFHDVPFPFEYPDEWIFSQNLSWNEAYFLRSFLMYNQSFRVVMWNSLLAKRLGKDRFPESSTFLRNPGTSIWIRKEN